MVKIRSIEKPKESSLMADIEVKSFPCFYANGIAVHNSGKMLDEAMKKKGIITGPDSLKSGQMPLSKEYLLAKSKEYPILADIVKRSSLSTQLNNYASKFTEKKEGYVSYQACNIATGRISSGNSNKDSSGGNQYFLSLNFQNLTKAKNQFYRVIPKDHELYDLLDSPDILDTKFIPVQENEMVVKFDAFGEIVYEVDEFNEPTDEPVMIIGPMILNGVPMENTNVIAKGQVQKSNIRSGITVPDDSWLFLSIDYTAEEIVLAGVMSGEPNYLEPFKLGEDIHKRTAVSVWGLDNYDEDKRTLAKKLNFGLQYGGGVYLLEHGMGLSATDAIDTYNAFWKALPTLKRYQDKTIAEAYKKNGTAYTYFGRPRRFKNQLFSQKFRDKKAGERAVLNHPIQGTAGDIIRLCLVKLYEMHFIIPETIESLRFVGTVHDEICLLVKKDKFYHWMPKILEIMEVEFKDCGIKLKCELEVGTSFGNTFVFERNEDGKYLPKGK